MIIRFNVRTRLLAAAISVALLPSAKGQAANQAEVGREISRGQGVNPFPVGAGQPEQAAITRELPERLEYGELRVLYNTRPLPTFTLETFGGALYTTNAALLPKHAIGDWYFQQGVVADWSKGFYQGTLLPHAAVSQAWYEYARPGVHGINNFSAMNAGLGVTYVLKYLANIAVSIDYVYERLADLGLSDENFHEHHLRVALNEAFAFSRTHSLFFQAYGDFSLGTEPTVTERHEYGAFIAYTIDWIPEVSTTLSYRYARYDYIEGPRQDNNHSFVLSLVWRVRPEVFLQAGADFVLNQSNVQPFNYRVFTGGPTASIRIRW
jgi:hypothetical protein